MWASRVLLFDRPHLLDSAGDGFTRAAVPFKRGHLDPASNYETQDEVFAPSGSAALFRRTLIADVGELDERFFLVHEDVDFGLRARLRRHRCLYVPDAIVKHKVNSSIGYLSWAYVFYGQRNLEWVYWKNLPWPQLLCCLPAHCVFNLLAFGHFVLKGHGLTFLQAKLAALIRLPGLLRQRRDIQSRRMVSTTELWRLMSRDWLATKLRIAKKTRRTSVVDPQNAVERGARV
jgi:GT2 family glycosyltransferase